MSDLKTRRYLDEGWRPSATDESECPTSIPTETPTPSTERQPCPPVDPPPAQPSTGSSSAPEILPEPTTPRSDPARGPTQPASSTRGPGRPSKLEERTWQVFLRTARPGMTAGNVRNSVAESRRIAEEFARHWKA